MASSARLEDRASNPPETPDLHGLADELEDALAELRSGLEDADEVEEPLERLAALADQVRAEHEQVEKTRDRAHEAEETLAEEQRRLEKLWSAYKDQEAEIEELEAERSEVRESLHAERERVRELEEDLEALETSRERARQEKAELQEELERRKERIAELEPFVEFEAEVEQLEAELEEERTRLAKLYAVFEETEAERDELQQRVEAWEAWADEHGDALQVLAEAAGEVPGSVDETPPEPEEPA